MLGEFTMIPLLIEQNRVPDDLYYHGIQRERMAGFLDALKSRCDVVELDGGRDWRRGLDPEKPIERSPTWYTTGDGEFETHWNDAGGASGESFIGNAKFSVIANFIGVFSTTSHSSSNRPNMPLHLCRAM